MSSIKITELEKNQFSVEVIDKETTFHKVIISDEIHQNLTSGEVSKTQLLKKSFEFLLEREPNTSILTNFEIQLISNYFSDYENYIRSWIEI